MPQVNVPSVPDVPVPGQDVEPLEATVPKLNLESPSVAAVEQSSERTGDDVNNRTASEGTPLAPRLLNESEQAIHEHVVASVLGKIDPLLLKLKEIAEQAETQTAKASTQILFDMEDAEHAAIAKVRELEAGINKRIEKRISKINAIIGKRGQ